ncbi:HD domain-containing protein [Planomonospora parontospora]|uniref:HD domain-containing protein n=1 Tax=Planomonospora parontospora TaxID=58119 RepID=UPI001670D240|nr:HD domain-containing protein [Planomonospora parontospora]
MGQAEWARELARTILEEPLPRRWAHSQGVAAKAESLAPILGSEADLLIASAWLHDIGYAPDLIDTGFHPLDGARYLRDVERADATLCGLVAYHSGAINEARERGLIDLLTAEFHEGRSELAEALIYCDITTGPSGERFTVHERLAEIRARYGPGDLVTRVIGINEPLLLAAVASVEAALADVR